MYEGFEFRDSFTVQFVGSNEANRNCLMAKEDRDHLLEIFEIDYVELDYERKCCRENPHESMQV